MLLTYLGHSCFEMTFSSGTRVVTDPFNESVGYPVPSVDAEVVTCSHGHFDHSYSQAIPDAKLVLTEPGAHEYGGVKITGIPSFHDDAQGTKRGPNILHKYESDGLTIVHLGDLGHLPDAAQITFLSHADVMLIPIGGFYTIDTPTALQIISLTSPRIVIPMHYLTPEITFPITDESAFVKATAAQYAQTQTLEITPETENGVWVLKHPIKG